MKLKFHKILNIILYLILIINISVSYLFSQEKDKAEVHFNLSDGFIKNEKIEILMVNKDGRKKIFSGKLDRIDSEEVNCFICQINKGEVTTFELYAKDRKISISYSVKITRTPLVTIEVSISDAGFHVLFSDKRFVYN